ncbi:MAG: hypothetical protein H6765_00705 [Candidatus Peribacteria bacterium]|nr:MAG: hypothetical protein H6765_00705 [Candidatus Peribacteria bacterium]
MVGRAFHIERLPVSSDHDAILLETQLINTHKPTYNNLIKGDTSYVYIKIRKEPFPNIELTRYKKPDGALYIGPKIRRRDLKYALQVLRHTFKYRSCSPSIFKKGIVCSDYFFGLCAGWCAYHANSPSIAQHNQRIGFVETLEPQQAKESYQAMLKLFVDFFKGSHKPLQQALLNEIELAVQGERYERAAKLRDCYSSVERLTQGQEVVLQQPRQGYFARIKAHKDRWYLVLLTLVDGKIIDVISKREHQNDIDLSSLRLMIAREYGTGEESDEQATTDVYKFDKPLNKQDQAQLHAHANNFLTGFINGTLAQTQEESEDILQQLQQRYQLVSYPIRIETLDISHS